MFRVGSALIFLSLFAVATLRAQAPAPSASQEPVVVTSGEGLVQATPDRAWITVGAESRAPSPREAQRRTGELMRPVFEALRAAKIPDEAVRTTGYDLQQEFDFTNGKRVPRGYVARNSIDTSPHFRPLLHRTRAARTLRHQADRVLVDPVSISAHSRTARCK